MRACASYPARTQRRTLSSVFAIEVASVRRTALPAPASSCSGQTRDRLWSHFSAKPAVAATKDTEEPLGLDPITRDASFRRAAVQVHAPSAKPGTPSQGRPGIGLQLRMRILLRRAANWHFETAPGTACEANR